MNCTASVNLDAWIRHTTLQWLAVESSGATFKTIRKSRNYECFRGEIGNSKDLIEVVRYIWPILPQIIRKNCYFTYFCWATWLLYRIPRFEWIYQLHRKESEYSLLYWLAAYWPSFFAYFSIFSLVLMQKSCLNFLILNMPAMGKLKPHGSRWMWMYWIVQLGTISQFDSSYLVRASITHCE